MEKFLALSKSMGQSQESFLMFGIKSRWSTPSWWHGSGSMQLDRIYSRIIELKALDSGQDIWIRYFPSFEKILYNKTAHDKTQVSDITFLKTIKLISFVLGEPFGINGTKLQWQIQDFWDGRARPRGHPSLFWPNFSEKLHANERIWQRGKKTRITHGPWIPQIIGSRRK